MHKIWWRGPLRVCVGLRRERKLKDIGDQATEAKCIIYSHVGKDCINKYSCWG